MAAMRLLPEFEPQRWEARITQGGHPLIWYVMPVKGLRSLNAPYLVFGTEARAERVARRKLARLDRRDEREAATRVIR